MSKYTLRASLVAAAGILIAIGGCAQNPAGPEGYQSVQTPPEAPSNGIGTAIGS
jgi:hypothetical protein